MGINAALHRRMRIATCTGGGGGRRTNLKDGSKFPGLDVRLLEKLAEKYIIKPGEREMCVTLGDALEDKVDLRWNVTKVE